MEFYHNDGIEQNTRLFQRPREGSEIHFGFYEKNIIDLFSIRMERRYSSNRTLTKLGQHDYTIVGQTILNAYFSAGSSMRLAAHKHQSRNHKNKNFLLKTFKFKADNVRKHPAETSWCWILFFMHFKQTGIKNGLNKKQVDIFEKKTEKNLHNSEVKNIMYTKRPRCVRLGDILDWIEEKNSENDNFSHGEKWHQFFAEYWNGDRNEGRKWFRNAKRSSRLRRSDIGESKNTHLIEREVGPGLFHSVGSGEDMTFIINLGLLDTRIRNPRMHKWILAEEKRLTTIWINFCKKTLPIFLPKLSERAINALMRVFDCYQFDKLTGKRKRSDVKNNVIQLDDNDRKRRKTNS